MIMQIHQINQLSYPGTLEKNWQDSLHEGDVILLIEDGILRLAIKPETISRLLQQKQVSLYFLESDAIAYGLSPDIGTRLSDKEWVDIALYTSSIISW